MIKSLIYIGFIALLASTIPRAEASFSFNLSMNFSYKTCIENGNIYAVVMDWDYCPSMMEILNPPNGIFNFTMLWVKTCKHNGGVYDVRNSSGICHFDNGIPNFKLQKLHEKEDGGHDCDLDEDDEQMYVGSGGVVM